MNVCRHLDDPSHRETYESAHSVVLAIFVAHAQKTTASAPREPGQLPFAEEFIPAYVQCLLDVRRRYPIRQAIYGVLTMRNPNNATRSLPQFHDSTIP